MVKGAAIDNSINKIKHRNLTGIITSSILYIYLFYLNDLFLFKLMHKVFLGLGSNLGDGTKNLNKALQYLNSEVGRIILTSSFILSEPWGYKSKKIYTNAVTYLQTELNPIPLLDKTQEIERKMGRLNKTIKGEGYKDRIIDIDILYYDRIHFRNDRLIIPHPLMKERDFVMKPLREILNKLKIKEDLSNLI